MLRLYVSVEVCKLFQPQGILHAFIEILRVDFQRYRNAEHVVDWQFAGGRILWRVGAWVWQLCQSSTDISYYEWIPGFVPRYDSSVKEGC